LWSCAIAINEKSSLVLAFSYLIAGSIALWFLPALPIRGIKERDAETGLDCFGFRYYSGAQGRWTSPDAPFADQHPENPQSWNLYGYVRNNPLNSIDPDGRGDLLDKAWPVIYFTGEFSGGVLRGMGASISFGINWGPQPSDSVPSLIGQLSGSTIVANMGAEVAGLGGLGEFFSDGTASQVCIPAIAAGGSAVLGAAKNQLAILPIFFAKALQPNSSSSQRSSSQGSSSTNKRFDGPKPRYTINEAHVPGSRGFNPSKTPLPNDAELVYRNAVPDDAINPRNWFGKNANGQIYRFSGGDGTVHFSGIDGVGDGIRNITKYALERLSGM
jgi:RHS repeat-associated protein